MIVSARDISAVVALKLQISLLEDEDAELRARWSEITLELSHLLRAAEKSLNQVAWAKNDKTKLLGERTGELASPRN